MLKKLKANIGLIIVLTIVSCIVILVAIDYHNELKMNNFSTVTDTAYHLPQEERPTHIDSLPYYTYKKITDSVKNISDNEIAKNTIHPWGYNISSGFIGLQKTFRTWYGWYTDNKSHFEPAYFISVPHYILDNKFNAYYRDGNYYLKHKISNRVEPIKVAYLAETKSILIPISEKAYNIAWIGFLAIIVPASIGLLYILLGLPINILISISRGKVFTKVNIIDLHLVAYSLLGFAFAQMLMPYIIKLFLAGRIPATFSISFTELLSSEVTDFIIGFIILVIARAFAKGYKLQQEQDLTI